MRNIVVVTFTEPGAAYRALGVITALDDSGRITLYTGAVVERLPGGEPAVREHRDRLGLSSRPRGLVGRLIDGLLGADDALDIAARIPPGETGLMAEVGEHEVDVFDRCMRQLGGIVFRASTDDVKLAFTAAEEARRKDEMKAAHTQMAAAEKQAQADWDAAWREQERDRKERHTERLRRLRGPPESAGTFDRGADVKAVRPGVVGLRRAEGVEKMPTMQEFFTKEHERLTKLETSLVRTKTEIEDARTEALGSLTAKREQLDAAREARHQQMSDATNRMKARLEAKKEEKAAAVEAWKHRREVDKLERRAQAAEEYADAAMTVLEFAHEEAKAATLEAIEARRVVDEARLQAGTTA